MKKSEVRRLSGKLSFQGKALKQRIAKQFKLVDAAKARERESERSWFKAKLSRMAAEDEMDLLCAVALAESQKDKHDKG